ncbi:hypothetical protein D3C78_1105870 [compost metagenome]
MSVTAPTVPKVDDIVTAAPPLVSAFPCASFSFTVIGVWLVPSAVREPFATAIVLFAPEGAPATNCTLLVPPIALPPTLALMVAVPTVVGAVNVAVYVPLLLSVTAPTVPKVDDIVTAAPPLVSAFPCASFNCTLTVV